MKDTQTTDGKSAASVCADEVRAHDFARYATTLFVAPERRRSLLALYAFSTEIARVRDLVSQPLPGEIRLQWWSDMLAGAAHGNVADNPVARELLDAIAACGLEPQRLSTLIDAHRFDLYDEPMPSMAALETYFDETAGVLYELSAGILGHRSDLVAHLAHHAGIAHGLVATIMRLPMHAARRQMFLPEDVLNEHGVRSEDVFAGRANTELFAALDYLAGEGRAHLNSANMLLKEASRDIRPAFLLLPLLRREFDAMARPDFDPFRARSPGRLGILWRVWRAARTM